MCKICILWRFAIFIWFEIGFLKLNLGLPVLFHEISVAWRKRHKWSEERDLSKCTLCKRGKVHLDNTLSGRHKTLCWAFMMFVEDSRNRERAVCLCSQQQFADLTANTVAERDWISWQTVGTGVTKVSNGFRLMWPCIASVGEERTNR